MLTHIKLNNFKIWRHTGQLALAPLTLLFGTNSSGKSSLIQSLLLLRQTVKSSDPNLDLNFGNPDVGDSVTLGQYRDVLCRHGADTETVKRTQIGIEFGWEGGAESAEHAIFSALYRQGTGGSAELAKLRIGRGTLGFTAERRRHGAYKLWPADSTRSIGQSIDFKPQHSFTFSTVAIAALGERARSIHEVSAALLEELGRIVYLGPVRRLAQRDYLWSGHMPGSIGDDGARAVDALIASGVAREEARRRGKPIPNAARLFIETAAWLRKMGLAEDLKVRALGRSARHELLVVNHGSASNLKDVGVGVSQVLPVIVAALFAERGHIVIIEEPESHLHPLAQAQLAELFVEVNRERGVQFIIETHSEHLLLRLQRRVAEELLRPEAVAMYFLRRTDDSVQLEMLGIDAEGEINNWPENFFGDDMGEITARTLAAISRETTQSGGEPIGVL
jgi:hypothetical protein